MGTVCRCIEVSNIVKRTLLDAFTTRIAHLIADATPEHTRGGSLYASKAPFPESNPRCVWLRPPTRRAVSSSYSL